MDEQEIMSIIGSINDEKDLCPLTQFKKIKFDCERCKFCKNKECTFDIWKWGGIGGND